MSDQKNGAISYAGGDKELHDVVYNRLLKKLNHQCSEYMIHLVVANFVPQNSKNLIIYNKLAHKFFQFLVT